MVRLILIGLCSLFVYMVLNSSVGSSQYWLSIIALAVLAWFLFQKVFAFFLATGLLAFGYSDVSSGGGFTSLFLPAYVVLSLIVLLVTLVLHYPEFLGQRVSRSGGGFFDGDGGGCGD